MAMKFKGILFDFDGTLIDTSGLIIASLQHTIKAHCCIELTEAALRPILGRTMRDTMLALAPEQPQDKLIATYRNHQITNECDMKLFQQVKEILQYLADKKIKMAIVTSRRRETAITVLERFGIDKYFSVVVGAHQCERHKPDPEPLYKALQVIDVLPQECMMIGDSPADIAGGHNAGMKSAAVRWTYMDWSVLAAEKPDYILDNWIDLKAIIE